MKKETKTRVLAGIGCIIVLAAMIVIAVINGIHW